MSLRSHKLQGGAVPGDMNDPVHQQRLAEIREAYTRTAKELRVRGEFEQFDSQPRGGHTNLRFNAKRHQDLLERHVREWHAEHFKNEREDVKFTRHACFIVKRSKCVRCGKLWYDHTPSGGQCLFMSTMYLEAPRAPR